jgi:isoleucyl-tRNA synthetase
MPFDKVETTQVDFPAQERAILEFWERIDAFNKLRAQNAGKPRWSFLDGPITANNPMGVHHAWGRAYKDVYQRYFAMTGHELRYQNGFDCQGLWVEVEVEKELKLGNKRDIENLVPGDQFASIDKFVNACKARVDRFARVQTNQSIRLGYWMDWDLTDADWAKSPDERKSYFTMSEENNYTIWSFLKKCFSRGFVYEGYDAMPWCARCGTGISQQEMNEGYKMVAHRSIFLRLPLHPVSTATEKASEPVGQVADLSKLREPTHSDKSATCPTENLLVWTTTPWTLTSNVAAAVNPDLTYIKVKQGNQIYYVGKAAFKTARLEDQFKAKDWVEGVPKLKTLEQLFKEKSKEGFEIVGEVKGEDLVGRSYDGPFDEFEAQNTPYGYPADIARVVEKQKWAPAISGKLAHRVVGWKDVGETEGTGIVHIAPGCGKEDFALGKEVGLPPVAPLDDSGVYLPCFGPLSGKSATSQDVVDFVVNSLKEKGVLFATEMYPHKYPHCWRCKNELLYRLVDEWYINMGPKPVMVSKDAAGRKMDEEVWQPGFRSEIAKVVADVTFLPEDLNGKARELDWLRNMGDWMISKKRYWGLALPIWVDDETGEFEVIGSRQELKERVVEGWAEFEGHPPHRPWIDKVKIRNPKTGNLMSRIPDVGNPWLDAGIVALSTMGFNRDRDYWKQWYPADFITESFPGQFRNWFYALLAMSTMMTDGMAPFHTLLGFATVQDQYGRPMHKSDGNAIEFVEAADEGFELFHDIAPKEDSKKALAELPKSWLSTREEIVERKGETVKRVYARFKPIGADVIRWMYCRHNPSSNVNFGPEPADELRAKFVLKLWNTYAFFCNYARLDNFDPAAPQVPVKDRPDIDRWILSDLQLLIKSAHEAFKSFNVMAFCLETEKFVDDKLSNWYVRRNRRRFWKNEKGADKQAAYQTLYTVLATLTKLIAPVVPFLAESMWQNLRPATAGKRSGGNEESVHLCPFPAADETLIDQNLSEDMESLLRLVSLGGSARNAGKVSKVRQPLAEAKIQPSTEADGRAAERFADEFLEELNIKKLTIQSDANGPLLKPEIKLNMKTAGPKFGAKLKSVQVALAAADPVKLIDQMRSAPVDLADAVVEMADLVVSYTAPDGWAGVADRSTQVAIDTRITPELAREGMARDIVRLVQDLRKNSGLEMEDRIILYLGADDENLKQAIVDHRTYIAAETLTKQWADAPFDLHSTSTKIDGQSLTIALKRT